MKKLLVFPLILLSLLFSCSTTEEVPHPVFEDPVVETSNVEVSEPEKEAVVVIDEPLVRKPAPEKKAEPSVKTTPAVTEEKPSVPAAAPKTTVKEEEKKDPVLSGKDLVNQISEEERNRKAAAAAAAIASTPETDDVKIPAVTEKEDVPEVTEEKAPGPVTEETAVETEEKVPEAPVVENTDSTVIETPQKEESVLDTKLDSRMMSVAIEIISILVIFALSSVIRNKYSRPLSLGLSFLLAILFTAIPMLIAFILSGWSNIHLMFMVLIFTVFIFSSRRGH